MAINKSSRSESAQTLDLSQQRRNVLPSARDEIEIFAAHRVYRAASAPRRFVCDDFDELERYVLKSTKPGDSLWFWNFENCCRDDNSVAHGKTPDEQGRVPMSGSY